MSVIFIPKLELEDIPGLLRKGRIDHADFPETADRLDLLATLMASWHTQQLLDEDPRTAVTRSSDDEENDERYYRQQLRERFGC
jgi:hypothetical protein